MIEQSIVHLPELVKDIDRPVSNYLVHLSSCFLREICLEKVACAREDDLSNELRFFLRNHLRDKMKPPRENPRRSTCSKPSARIKATASRAGGAGYSADWWTPTAFSALLLRQELESLLDELLVELEDSAVAGVRVDHQLVVRQTSGHVEGVRRGQHPVVIAVREEHGVADE